MFDYDLYLYQDSLKIKVVNNEIDNERIFEDVNEEFLNYNQLAKIFKGNHIPIILCLGAVSSYCDYFIKQNEIDREVAVRMILSSDIWLNKELPKIDYTIKNKLNLSSSIDDVKKLEKDHPVFEYETKFSCKSNLDLLTGILYFYLIRGYHLNFCNNCQSWFFTKDNRFKYCKYTCQETYAYKQQYLKRENDANKKLLKKIRDRLRNWEEDTLYDFNYEYNQVFKVLTKEDLYNWLLEKDKVLRFRKRK